MKKLVIIFLMLVIFLGTDEILKAQTTNISENTQADTHINHKQNSFVQFFQNAFSPMNHEEKRAYEKGYKAGVREQLKKFKTNFVDNQVPYYYWQSPIVQQVKIPAQVVNGLFIPSHYEYVIIKPGDWQKEYGYPIAKGENNNEK